MRSVQNFIAGTLVDGADAQCKEVSGSAPNSGVA